MFVISGLLGSWHFADFAVSQSKITDDYLCVPWIRLQLDACIGVADDLVEDSDLSQALFSCAEGLHFQFVLSFQRPSDSR